MLVRDEAVASHLFVLYAARSAIRAHQAKRLLFNGTSIIVIGIVRRIIFLGASAPFITTRRSRLHNAELRAPHRVADSRIET